MYRCSIRERLTEKLHNCNGFFTTHRYPPFLKFRQRQKIFVQFPTATWSINKHWHETFFKKFRRATWEPPLAGPHKRLSLIWVVAHGRFYLTCDQAIFFFFGRRVGSTVFFSLFYRGLYHTQWVKFRQQRGVWKSSITSKINKIDQTKNWAKSKSRSRHSQIDSLNIWKNTVHVLNYLPSTLKKLQSFKAFDAVVEQVQIEQFSRLLVICSINWTKQSGVIKKSN